MLVRFLLLWQNTLVKSKLGRKKIYFNLQCTDHYEKYSGQELELGCGGRNSNRGNEEATFTGVFLVVSHHIYMYIYK